MTSSAFTRPLVLPPLPAPRAEYMVVGVLLGEAREGHMAPLQAKSSCFHKSGNGRCVWMHMSCWQSMAAATSHGRVRGYYHSVWSWSVLSMVKSNEQVLHGQWQRIWVLLWTQGRSYQLMAVWFPPTTLPYTPTVCLLSLSRQSLALLERLPANLTTITTLGSGGFVT